MAKIRPLHGWDSGSIPDGSISFLINIHIQQSLKVRKFFPDQFENRRASVLIHIQWNKYWRFSHFYKKLEYYTTIYILVDG